MNLVRLTGILCMIVGAATAAMAFMNGYAPIIALATAILGFLLSSAHISLRLRYGVETKFINPGFVGLLLSSTPLLLILYLSLTK